MATIGSFTEGVARHVDTGKIEQSSDGTVTSCSETYQVVVADASVRISPAAITGIPQKNAAHPTIGDLYVDGYSWSHIAKGSKVWECAVHYKRKRLISTGSGTSAKSEIVTLMDWGYESGSSDVVADVDSGNPLVNSAGDPFDTVSQYDEVHPVVRYGVKTKDFDVTTFWWNNCINMSDVTVLGIDFPAHTCRLRIECRKNLDDNDFPYEWTYTFEGRSCWVKSSQLTTASGSAPSTSYDTDGGLSNIGWDLAILQCGYRYLDSNDEPVKFVDKDEDGNPIEASAPHLLNTDGTELSPTADGIFLLVRVYREANFANIAPTDPDLSPATPTQTT